MSEDIKLTKLPPLYDMPTPECKNGIAWKELRVNDCNRCKYGLCENLTMAIQREEWRAYNNEMEDKICDAIQTIIDYCFKRSECNSEIEGACPMADWCLTLRSRTNDKGWQEPGEWPMISLLPF